MYPKVQISTLTLFLTVLFCNAQVDSIETTLFKIPDKFFSQTSSKIDKYNNRLTGKTNKTLEKLARWENKIKRYLIKPPLLLLQSYLATINSLLMYCFKK